MSDKSSIFTLPPEIVNSPKKVKDAYKEYAQLSQDLENHPQRYLVLESKYGEEVIIDCAGIATMNIKKAKRYQVKNLKKAEEEIKRRGEEIFKLKRQKGAASRRFRQYLVGNSKQNILDLRKQDILEMFGRYHNVDQVWAWIKNEGFSMQRGRVMEFYENNIQEIKDRRMRFQAEEKDFYLATTTGRLESLSYLHTKNLELFEDTKNRGYASECRSIIEQIRKEVKGDEIKLTINGQIDLTATLQANQTLQEFNNKRSINLMILSLVAGERGINPMDLLAQLSNSYYKRWNGFSELATDEEEIKLPSHFIKNYDWQAIEKIHKEKDEKATDIIYRQKLERFFKKEGVSFNGDVNTSLQQLKKVCGGEAVSEIIDVKPIEVEVSEEEKPIISNKRDKLKELLDAQKKKIKEDGKGKGN